MIFTVHACGFHLFVCSMPSNIELANADGTNTIAIAIAGVQVNKVVNNLY